MLGLTSHGRGLEYQCAPLHDSVLPLLPDILCTPTFVLPSSPRIYPTEHEKLAMATDFWLYVKDMVRGGHTMINHSSDHPSLPSLGAHASPPRAAPIGVELRQAVVQQQVHEVQAQHVALALRPRGCGGAPGREGGVARLKLGDVSCEGVKVVVGDGEEDAEFQRVGGDRDGVNGDVGTRGDVEHPYLREASHP